MSSVIRSAFKVFSVTRVMASLLDSEAQFIQRTLDLKLSDELKQGLRRAQLQTLGTLAYARGQPGQHINDEIFSNWITTNILTGASVADIAGAKRLLFEAQTMMMASLQEQVTVSDQSAVKKIPVVERETKMKAIRTKLCGLLIEGALEPAHCLLDLTANMHQINEVRYIAPERGVSRSHEVLTSKTPSKQLDISAESLVVKEKTDVPDMAATSAMQVHEALQRRGIALVFADLVQYQNYSKYLSTLFGHLHREPPAGYNRCSVSQLVTADKLVFQSLLEAGVQPKRDEAGVLALGHQVVGDTRELQGVIRTVAAGRQERVNRWEQPQENKRWWQQLWWQRQLWPSSKTLAEEQGWQEGWQDASKGPSAHLQAWGNRV